MYRKKLLLVYLDWNEVMLNEINKCLYSDTRLDFLGNLHKCQRACTIMNCVIVIRHLAVNSPLAYVVDHRTFISDIDVH